MPRAGLSWSRRVGLFLSLLLFLASLPLQASAQLFPAFTQSDTFSNTGWGVNTTRGWSFTVSSRLLVEQLGFWDSGGNGLGSAHPVGLWRGDGTLLASVTVPAGLTAPLEGTFRWVALASQVALVPGETYVVGAYWVAGDPDTTLGGGEDVELDARVAFVDGRATVQSGLAYPWQSSGLDLSANFKARPALAPPPVAEAFQITMVPAFETTPRLGNDGTSDLVVFTMRTRLGDGSFAPADVWYQRVSNGMPIGWSVQVSGELTDDRLNDVSGDYVVYTAYDTTTSTSGTIMLFRISTREVQPLAQGTIVDGPRIQGGNVVWVEGSSMAASVKLYQLEWLGTPQLPVNVVAPVPPASQVDIGSRFIVWSQRIDTQFDVQAFDLISYNRYSITTSSGIDDTAASTYGDWIVWQSQRQGASTSTIEAINLRTFTEIQIANDGALAENPSVEGDLVVWESNRFGNRDIFLYRFSTGETFQVTTDPADQYLADVFWSMIAYTDDRNGSEDVYITAIDTPTEGLVEAWGFDAYRQASPPRVFAASGTSATIGAGAYHSCAIAAGFNRVLCWGQDDWGQSSPPSSVDGTSGLAKAISAGAFHNCAIQSGSNAVVCWGQDLLGQSTPPNAVNGVSGTATAVAAGGFFSCAIQSGSGAVVCWGTGYFGEEPPPPTVDGTSGTARAIAAGSSHACAIQSGSDAVVCWGRDDDGQASPPDSVNGVAGTARSITAGDGHSCAIQTGSGAVVCWGRNDWQQSTPPDSVNGVAGSAVVVSAGSAYTCAIQTSSAAVVCWGRNSDGQATPPDAVNGIAGTARAIAAGGEHTLATAYVPEPGGVVVWTSALVAWTSLVRLRRRNEGRARPIVPG